MAKQTKTSTRADNPFTAALGRIRRPGERPSQGKARRVCYALEDAEGIRNEDRRAAYRIVQRLLGIFAFLERWVEHHHPDLYDSVEGHALDQHMQATRVAWLEWLEAEWDKGMRA